MIKKNSLKSYLVVIGSFLVLSSAFSFVFDPQTVSAAVADDSKNNPDNWYPQTRAKRWAYLTGLYNCIDDADAGPYWSDRDTISRSRVSVSNTASGDWMWNPTGPRDRPNHAASYIDIETKSSGNGKADCNVIVKSVMREYSMSGKELMCALGGKKEDGTGCLDSVTDSKYIPPDDSARLDLTKIWGTKDLSQSASGPAYAVLNYEAFTDSKGCNAKEIPSKKTGDSYYTITTISNETGKPQERYFSAEKKDHEINVYTSYPGLNDQKRSCETIAADATKYSVDYAEWVKNHPDADYEDTIGSTNTIKDTDETSCAVDGVGWIVCPLMSFLADINDQAFGYLDNLLTIRPALITDPSTTKAWSAFRDIANVAFVIAFLIIIYSQISGVGVSNYGIKKLIPKLVAAAILVNVSYVVCAIMVDLSNIVGTSAYELLNSSIDIGEGGPANGAVSDTWSGVISALLKAGVVIGLIAALFLAPMVLLALAMVLLILVGRQAFVILLIVISPLAFVAFLLPNTEDWFKKWWKAFTVTLMVYPVVGIVFGASALASNILMNVANDGGSGDDENMLKIVALSVLAIPLFAVPALIKGSLSALGSVGGKLSGLQDKANGVAKKNVMNGRIGEAKNAFGARRQERKVKRRRGEGRLATWGSDESRKDTRRGKIAAFVGTRQKYIDESPFGQTIGGDKGAAAAVYQKQEAASERIRNTKALLEDDDPATLPKRASELLIKANARGDMDTARAASQVLRDGGRTGREKLNETLQQLETGKDKNGNDIPDSVKLNETLKKGIQADGLGKHKEHDSVMNQWSEGKGTFAELAAADKTISRLNQQQLASQDTARLEDALGNNTLQKHQAEAVLDGYSKGTISLDDDRLEIFRKAAAKPARPPSPTSPTPPSPGPTGPTAPPHNPFPPSSGGTP